MPGPWVSSAENAGFMAARVWREGEIIEAVIYDNSLNEQGKALWTVVADGKHDRRGRFLEVKLIIAEDDHLNWWLKHGDGARFKGNFFLHLCHKETSRCKDVNPRRPKEFHTDKLRILDQEDIRLRKAAWWQLGATKADFEKFRAELLGEAEAKGPGGVDDEFDFELSDAEPPAKPAAAEGSDDEEEKDKKRRKRETQLEKDLKDLKKVTEKKDEKKKKPPAGEERAKADKKKEKSVDPKGRDDDKRKRDGKSDDAPEEHVKPKTSRLWFGKKPGRDDEVKDDAKEKRRKKVSSSDSSTSSKKRKKKKKEKKKKKKAKRKDRGPYGIGQKVNFENDDGSSSESSSDESVFRGGAPKERSQQLQLMEYAMINPGRLTSRLLLKMQNLLAKEGAPINQERPGNMTPATATAYLLTILIPTRRERLGVLLREMRTIAGAVDEIARGHPEAAGDILSQRLKALELQLVDNNWQRAQFLELIPQEGAGLSERSEQAMASREQMQDLKMRGWNQDNWKGNPKGGGEKGKGKKGKKGAKNVEASWGGQQESQPPAA